MSQSFASIPEMSPWPPTGRAPTTKICKFHLLATEFTQFAGLASHIMDHFLFHTIFIGFPLHKQYLQCMSEQQSKCDV